MAYDYREAIKADVKAWIDDNYELIEENVENPAENTDEAYEFIYETLWTEDSVTGNASGSYTFNRTEARDNLEGNEDLAREALREFGYPEEHYFEKVEDEEFEYLDVTVRCYLLGEAVGEAVENARRLAKGE